jgi:hypothetical protein
VSGFVPYFVHDIVFGLCAVLCLPSRLFFACLFACSLPSAGACHGA